MINLDNCRNEATRTRNDAGIEPLTMQVWERSKESHPSQWPEVCKFNLRVHEECTYSVSQKSRPAVFRHFPPNGWEFLINFIHLLCVPIYARLQIFIHLSPTLTKHATSRILNEFKTIRSCVCPVFHSKYVKVVYSHVTLGSLVIAGFLVSTAKVRTSYLVWRLSRVFNVICFKLRKVFKGFSFKMWNTYQYIFLSVLQ